MIFKTLIFALALVPTLISADAGAGAGDEFFPEDGPVTVLTGKDFKKTLKEERSAIVMFFAPWCGHCKTMKPEYTNAATALGPLIPFYAVNCDDTENKGICGEYQVKGFPTVKTFPKGLKGAVHDYKGERKARAIVEFLNTDVPNRVQVLKGEDSIHPWVEKNPSVARAILVTNKSKVPLQWKVLQNNFNTEVLFAAIKDTDGEVAKKFGIDSKKGQESVVLVWYVDAKDPVLYMGPKRYEPLVEFLTEARDSGKPAGEGDKKAGHEEL